MRASLGGSCYFFFAGAFFSAFTGAFALAFFLSLLCELLPFAMVKSFRKSYAGTTACFAYCMSFCNIPQKTLTFTGTFLLIPGMGRMNSNWSVVRSQ